MTDANNTRDYNPNATIQGNTFNGAGQLVQLDSSAKLPAVDGSAVINLAGGNLTGTLPTGTLPANVTLQGNVTNAANGLVKTNGSNQLPALDGSLLTNIPVGHLAQSTITSTAVTLSSVGWYYVVTTLASAITLPALSGLNYGDCIKITQGGVGLITIGPNSGDTINANPTFSANSTFTYTVFNANGTKKWVVG